MITRGIGQPKSTTGATFSGVPGAGASRAWTFFHPSGQGQNGPTGFAYYCPVLIPEPLSIRDIEVVTEGQIPVAAEARVAISQADLNWQPSGSVLYQGKVTIPSTAKTFDGFHPPIAAPVLLRPGLHLFALECNEPTRLFLGRPASFDGGVFCQDNPTGPNQLLDGLVAPHTYGPFTSLPRWTTTSTFQESLYGGWVAPFVVKWTTP